MDQQQMSAAVREQANWCGRLGSPLYQDLLLRAASDIEASGLWWGVLEPFSGDPRRSLLPLRFLAMLHRLALEGSLPELAACYPSCGGSSDAVRAWAALTSALQNPRLDLRPRVPETVQTNEVGRCCALLPGFLEIARHTGLPLRLLEIGASAGLNLRWDCYRYETRNGGWGSPDSPVVFRDAFVNGPALNGAVQVVERCGCDLNPIGLNEDGRMRLLSFVWPDQTERFRQLSNAIDVARRVPASLDQADAPPWMQARLAEAHPGAATVLFHSIVLLYFGKDARARVASILAEAGARATKNAPVAWLAMEPGETEADVFLTLWPGGRRRRIAKAGYHGRNIEIVDAESDAL